MKTSSFYTFSILPSPHPSCWRNSQPSLQVAGLPRPAEHVFSSPGRVTLRSFIHFQWYSNPRSPACILIFCCALATDDEFLSANRQIKEERIWKERRKMDRPPPMSPDASRPRQFATQSLTCNFKGRIVCCATIALQMFKLGDGFELWPQMNFLSRLRGT